MTTFQKTRNKHWQGCGKRKYSYTVGGNKNGCNHWTTVWRFLKKLKIEIPFDLGIPLLRIYLKKTRSLIQKDICTLMFITALFTIAKKRKQPKCPSTDEWIKNMWYIYTMEYYLPIIRK